MTRFAVIFLVSLLLVLLGYWIRSSWLDLQFQTRPWYMIEYYLKKEFQNARLEDILLKSVNSDGVYWYRPDMEEGFQSASHFTDVYIIPVESATPGLKVNGLKLRDAVGVVCSVGMDKDLDFNEEDMNILQFNPTNGSKSNGDIVWILHK